MPIHSLQPNSMAVPAAPFAPGTQKGSIIFTSGQVAFDSNGNLVGGGDVKAQTLQVLQNIKLVIEVGGATLNDVMKTTVFLADMKDFAKMNEVYADFFGNLKPARSTIQAPLARPEFLVEIEAIAIIGD